jgi:hypothetical protein
MTKEQALKIIEAVCAKFVGTLQDHMQVQEALKVIKEEKKEE